MSRALALGEPPAGGIRDAAVKAAVKGLAVADNWTNWIYVVRAWSYLAVVLGAAAWACESLGAVGQHWLWCLPVWALALPLVG